MQSIHSRIVRLLNSTLARASMATGIGAPEHACRGLALAGATLRMSAASLAFGMAVNDKAKALKIFGCITCVHGLSLYVALKSLPWGQGGTPFACIVVICWIITMGCTASKGFFLSLQHFREHRANPHAPWRMRDASKVAAHDRWHMSMAIASTESANISANVRL